MLFLRFFEGASLRNFPFDIQYLVLCFFVVAEEHFTIGIRADVLSAPAFGMIYKAPPYPDYLH
jgi:hypothetical protein